MPATTAKTVKAPEPAEIAESFRAQYLAGVKQQQKLALDAATAWADAVAKFTPQQFPQFPQFSQFSQFAPAPAVPVWSYDVREAAKANFDFSAELLQAQREFTASLLDVLAPPAV